MFPFRKLPAELRLMLWRFTWTDRVVIIQLGKMENHTPCKDVFYTEVNQGKDIVFNDTLGKIHEDFNRDIIHTHAKLPPTFFVDRESRYETLKFYKLVFQLPGRESRIYFRRGADLPCLNWHDLWNFKDCPEMAEIEELMVISVGYMYIHLFFQGQSIFWMSKKKNGKWCEVMFNSMTGHTSDILLRLCPKLDSLYWTNEYVYEVDPWRPRTAKNGRSGLTMSMSWIP